MKAQTSIKPGDRVLVLGLGRSGESAARLLLALGARVTVADSNDSPALAMRADRLRQAGIAVITNCHIPPEGRFALAVTSPGIPADAPLLAGLIERSVSVISELELGWECCPGRILAVTGSSGKSTLTKLCHDALRACGKKTAIGANYGTPLSELVRGQMPADWYVLEVSSFQLEFVRRFKPDIAILLNLFPNHLDRHRTMEVYTLAKMKLFRNLQHDDCAVIPGKLKSTIMLHQPMHARRITFGVDLDDDIHYRLGYLEGRGLGDSKVDLRGTSFDNSILGLTAAAAAAAMCAAGCDPGVIGRIASCFEPLPHRMQTVTVVKGVRFIDDSKATALMSLAAALVMAGDKIRLIAGGRLKETDVTTVRNGFADHIEKIYLIGESASVLMTAWNNSVPCVVCGNLETAVKSAWQDAREGDTVLLSPGCASFDQFSGFEDRGNKFIEIVKSLER